MPLRLGGRDKQWAQRSAMCHFPRRRDCRENSASKLLFQTHGFAFLS